MVAHTSCAPNGASVWLPALLVEDERHEHVDLILGNFPVGDADRLLLDPRALDVADRLVGARQTAGDGVLEALL